VNEQAIMARLAAVEARLAALEGNGAAGPKNSATGKPIADDDELDSERGDPVVKRDPKNWEGESYAGCTMSQCPPKYLRMLASLFDWMGDKDDEQGKTWKNREGKEIPASTFKRKDAARARGWAKRNEGKMVARATGSASSDAASPTDGDSFSDESEIPF
jgi:hypothetical protein